MHNKKLNAFVIFVISLQVLLDILIYLGLFGFKILLLRQILSLGLFIFIPGLIVLRTLNIHYSTLTDLVIYSVGLSTLFIMFTGTLINSILPLAGISKPIAETPLLIAFNILIPVLLALMIIYHDPRKDAKELEIIRKSLTNIHFPLASILSMLPLLSIFGAILLIYNNSNILISLLYLILAIIPIAMYLDKIPESIYPFAIWCISLSFLLSHMVSLKLAHADIPILLTEDIAYISVLKEGFWDPTLYGTHYGMLSESILQPILSIVVKDQGRYCPILLYSLIPLILYKIYKKFMDCKFSFLSVYLFISMFSFLEVAHYIRQLFALFFLSLMTLSMLDENINYSKRFLLTLMFGFALITSHYGTSYLFMYSAILSVFILILFKERRSKEFRFLHAFTRLYIILSFGWYMFVSGSANFDLFVNFLHHTINSIIEGFTIEQSYTLYATVRQWPSLSIEIQKYLILIVCLFIAVGVLSSTLKMRENFDSNFLALSIAFLSTNILIFPPISTGFNPARILQSSLIFLAPFAVIGYQELINFFIFLGQKLEVSISNSKNYKFVDIIFSVFIAILFLFNSGFVSEVVTKDYSYNIIISKDRILKSGNIYQKAYLYKDTYRPVHDIYASLWLENHKGKLKVYTDDFGYERRLRYVQFYLYGTSTGGASLLTRNITKNDIVQGYIFLAHHNIIEDIVIEKYYPKLEYFNTTELWPVLEKGEKVYDCVYSRIYYL